MSNTYQICEVTVTIPKIGIITRDVEGNEFKCGEVYRINFYAVNLTGYLVTVYLKDSSSGRPTSLVTANHHINAPKKLSCLMVTNY